MADMAKSPGQAQPYPHVPTTISRQPQEFLRTIKDPHLIPTFPDAADVARP